MPKPLSGLQKVAKLYGGLTANGKRCVWDYASDEAVPEAEMKPGSERWKASERAKWDTPAQHEGE
jgi:hypothetical protein